MPSTRRPPLFAAALLLCVGCVPSITPAFDRAARVPADPAQPIVGAWAGRWTSEDGTAGGPARVVVTATAGDEPGTRADRFALELGDFPLADGTRPLAGEAVVDPRDGPVRDFAAKVPAVVLDGGLCAAALGLQAHADGDRLRIDYWVNDAIQQIDAGRIDLRRAGTATPNR